MKPLLLLAAFALGNPLMAKEPTLADYDVSWRSPSADAAGSMPIGNGEVVLNAWVEAKTGDVMILIGRTDALSEISRILKVGRVRVKLSPSPFLGTDFEQRLALGRGQIDLKGDGERLKLFVDSEAHVVHLAGKLRKPRSVRATLEVWRDQPRPLPRSDRESGWSIMDAPFPLVESADVVVPGVSELGWYHHNATSVVPKLWENQSLTGLPGTFDPILGRTSGGWMAGSGLRRNSDKVLASDGEVAELDLKVATHTAMSIPAWQAGVQHQLAKSPTAAAEARTKRWWAKFWNRSHVYIQESTSGQGIPQNTHALRVGVDSGGGNAFPGAIADLKLQDRPDGPSVASEAFRPQGYLKVQATITPTELRPGRIVDKLTAGQNDGFLFDTHPGNALRLIVGDLELSAPNCLKAGIPQRVEALYDAKTGEAGILLNGKQIAHRTPESGSLITRGYILQRYVQACQGRGEFPIKFNGGYFTVEPSAMGLNSNPDYRKWGDCHWFQNQRHMVHPMLAMGDLEMTDPFFRLYEKVRPLAEARTQKYHGAQGAYFPETMSVYGTYSGNDYGWNRAGLQPKDVQCPWWDDAWNQGPELVALMLDRWDYSRDEKFLKERVIPMAKSVLQYFDTRFTKDPNRKIVLSPTQVVETYWSDVVNDMPTVAGLIAITDRLVHLPSRLISDEDRATFARLRAACPDLPVEDSPRGPELAPAAKYKNERSNVENGELYAVWPFQLVSVGSAKLLEEAKRAYASRGNHLDNGWGYDGNVAALLGMRDEAARILRAKARNSHPAYRWPATWGPNFDWLPDMNHGGNLLNTTNLMLLQADPLEAGGKIRLLPAWPKDWDVRFKLHAPGNTTVECVYEGGKVKSLKVLPKTRARDLLLP